MVLSTPPGYGYAGELPLYSYSSSHSLLEYSYSEKHSRTNSSSMPFASLYPQTFIRGKRLSSIYSAFLKTCLPFSSTSFTFSQRLISNSIEFIRCFGVHSFEYLNLLISASSLSLSDISIHHYQSNSVARWETFKGSKFTALNKTYINFSERSPQLVVFISYQGMLAYMTDAICIPTAQE